MALKFDIETAEGFVISYHKIAEINIDWMSNTATTRLASYANNAARAAGKHIVQMTFVDISGMQDIFIKECAARAQVYAYLKTLPEYSSASDV